ncbi:MAG: pseudouridine synthase [Dehalogenimonas sp.]|uniref:Pseudouridine synthase n=1 Tax=Candidatus Dehalogenimonas loeffleri TaxID=3127115 RepID=A0ABZ2J2N1_9CHLR|nr:pseudouridine synthase [Dehalogenimonas sp.]
MRKTRSSPVAAPGLTLLKALRDAGAGSRRELAEAIKKGQVTVNDIPAEGYNLELANGDIVKLNDQIIELTGTSANKIYLILNKPLGIISTTDDPQGRTTVLDLIPESYRRYQLFPVGRLDENTTGLILLTNDGELTHRLTHPSFGVEKEYLVAINGALTVTDFEKVKEGIVLDDGLSAPAMIHPVLKAPYNYRVIIHEGRKRIVRRLFAALGHQVRILKRIRIGSIELRDLKEGNYRRLSPSEIQRLTRTAAQPPKPNSGLKPGTARSR